MNHLPRAPDNLNYVISSMIEIHMIVVIQGLNTSVGDTINKFTAVVNNKWWVTSFPRSALTCSDTNDELATGVNDPMGQIVRWCH
jgi:hypothetical protein